MATEQADADAIGRRYLTRSQEDTLRPPPLWTRLIMHLETALLVNVAARSGVINEDVGGVAPVARAATEGGALPE